MAVIAFMGRRAGRAWAEPVSNLEGRGGGKCFPLATRQCRRSRKKVGFGQEHRKTIRHSLHVQPCRPGKLHSQPDPASCLHSLRISKAIRVLLRYTGTGSEGT